MLSEDYNCSVKVSYVCLCNAGGGLLHSDPCGEECVWCNVLLWWDNGGCITPFSHHGSLLLHPCPLTQTHTDTPVSPPSSPLSERLHSLAYRLKPALTVLAPLTHTLSRGHTTLWNNYSLNWQLINLKSIWPCQANLELESRGSPDTRAKGLMEGWRKKMQGRTEGAMTDCISTAAEITGSILFLERRYWCGICFCGCGMGRACVCVLGITPYQTITGLFCWVAYLGVNYASHLKHLCSHLGYIVC